MQLINESGSEAVLRKNRHIENKMYFNSIDVIVTGACILGDKMLNSTYLLYMLVTYLIIRIMYSSAAYNFALLLLLIPNLGIMQISVGSSSIPVLNMLICLTLVKLAFSLRHIKIKGTYIYVIGFFLAYEWGHAVYYNLNSIFLLFSWSAAVLYVSLYSVLLYETYHHRIAVKHFIAGVFISTMYGMLDFLNRYGSLVNHDATIRFHGGAGDANYYSMYSMIAMFCMLYLISRETNKLPKIIYPFLFLLLMAFGILSLSRMFLLVVTLICFLLVFKVIFSVGRSKRLITFILFVVAYVSFFIVYYREDVFSIIELLFSRFTDFIDDPAALTSNRNIIAEQYMELIFSDYIYLIFGIGIQDYHLRSGVFLEAHNILLELFVVWGIVGFLVFLCFILMLIKYINPSKTLLGTNFIGWLPLLCMGISFMSINAMSNESSFLLLLFAMKNVYEYGDFDIEGA